MRCVIASGPVPSPAGRDLANDGPAIKQIFDHACPRADNSCWSNDDHRLLHPTKRFKNTTSIECLWHTEHVPGIREVGWFDLGRRCHLADSFSTISQSGISAGQWHCAALTGEVRAHLVATGCKRIDTLLLLDAEF